MKKSTLVAIIIACVFSLLCICEAALFLSGSCSPVSDNFDSSSTRHYKDSSGNSSDGEENSEPIDDCKHILVTDWIIDVKATCTETGSKHKQCAVCGEKLNAETINSLGHNYINDVCTRCGVGKYDDCKHATVTDWIVDVKATCTETGSKHKQCTVCKTVTNTARIPATGHTASDWVIEKEATCTESGSRYNYCTVCSEKLKTESISALGHNYVNGVCTRCNAKEPAFTRNGNYIYFGSYPQSEVTDSVTLNSLSAYTGTLPTNSNNQNWTDCEYYMGGSSRTAFMWYKDVDYNGKKYRAIYFTDYRPWKCSDSSVSTDNTYQDENGYNKGTVYWFKYESIKWRILTENNDSAFLMSEIAIDSQQYYRTSNGSTRTINGKTVYENNYAQSDIRAWLNKTFYNTAFSSLQKSLIKTTLVDNSAASTNPYKNSTEWNKGVNKYACENTYDKIFLLSEKEVTNNAYGFSSSCNELNPRREINSSDYANCQGCRKGTEGKGFGDSWWLLRSPNCNYTDTVRSVYSNGYANRRGIVDSTFYGVVPALWLTL